MRRWQTWGLGAAAGIAGLALAGSFLGHCHPAGDTLAVFRPAFALGLVLALAPLPRWRWGGLAAAALVILASLWPLSPSGPGGDAPLTLYQKNLLFTLADPTAIIADIHASDADIVTLQEVSRRNRAVLTALLAEYPQQLLCPAHTVGGVAVLSRLPTAGPGDCLGERGAASLPVETPLGRISIVSLHLHWPWPFGQAVHLNRLTPDLAALPAPRILAGDFNMVPWGDAIRQLARATDTARISGFAPTLRKAGYPLRIDHVLLPGAMAARHKLRPRLGSDHRGVLVRVWPNS